MLVISDFNGTLSHGSPILGLAGWVGENQSKLRQRLFWARIMPSYLLAKQGLMKGILSGKRGKRQAHWTQSEIAITTR